jgi:hypothetical protein
MFPQQPPHDYRQDHRKPSKPDPPARRSRLPDPIGAIRDHRQNHKREHPNQGTVLDFKLWRGEFHPIALLMVLLRHHTFVYPYNPVPSRTIEKKLLDVDDGEKRGMGAVVLQV